MEGEKKPSPFLSVKPKSALENFYSEEAEYSQELCLIGITKKEKDWTQQIGCWGKFLPTTVTVAVVFFFFHYVFELAAGRQTHYYCKLFKKCKIIKIKAVVANTPATKIQ